MSGKSVKDLLRERPGRRTPLQRLLRQSANQQAWTAELSAVLPAGLRHACNARAIRGDALVVVCFNSAVATRLRLLGPELVEQLRALPHFSHIERISVEVSAD